jgi:SRSO17 transposase
VMATYAAVGGHAFIGHRLYLPKRWTSDPGRCREAGIPKDVQFATKPEQAVELLAEADDAKVPYRWVAVDGGYGQYRVVRDWCTTRSRRYVVAVPSSQSLARVHAIGAQQGVKRADDLLGRATRWERRSCGHGSKGERFYDWAFFTVTLPGEPAADGFEHTLLIRRSIADPGEIGYFLAHAPTATPVKDMVAVAGIRWRIEECNEQSKDLLGLDSHQVRTWTAFHHHVAVCLFAHAFAATRRAHQQRLAATHAVLTAHAGDTGEETTEGAHRGNDPDPIPLRHRKPFPSGDS